MLSVCLKRNTNTRILNTQDVKRINCQTLQYVFIQNMNGWKKGRKINIIPFTPKKSIKLFTFQYEQHYKY